MNEPVRHHLNISGVASASGGIFDDVRIQGVGKIHGDVDCNLCRIEGVASIFGNVKSKKMRVRGKAHIEGNVTGEEVRIEGDCTIDGNCEAERIQSSGSFTVEGLMSADEIHIRLHGGAHVKEIGGGTIRVQKAPKMSIFSRFKKLTVNTIEGDDIHLESTHAQVVRGNHVYIGSGCEIGVVEYQSDFSQESDAKVSDFKQV